MAGELVGGALLSAFLQVAFDRLASRNMLDYFRGRRLDEKLLKKLNVSLLSINAVIDDAEEKHISDKRVRAWLDEVKDAVLDAEDLLDEIDYEATKCKVEAESQTTSSKVLSYFSASVSSFDKALPSRMKEILDSLEFLASQKEILRLKEGSGVGVGLGPKGSQRLPTTSLVDKAAVCGRDDDKKVIIDLMLSDTESGKNFTVISIVGMGGMGKTTLAQLVYNDSRMIGKFDLKAWVCVSEEFDIFKIYRTILKALNLSVDDAMDLNALQVKLKEKLTGKKFLLVLDDMWNENDSNLEALQKPFVDGAHGSKILVTTRSENVALTMGSAKRHWHQLKQLSKEDSWFLFSKHALPDGDPRSNARFEEIGRQIITKCKGLPLALKTIGSLLYTKPSYEEWKGILVSEMWDLSDDGCNIIPALRLSYQYLPSPLKRCFAYCSLVPKDFEFDKESLVELWMAENFLNLPKQKKSMKELGDGFFNDLLSRSFFQRSSQHETLFVMHDLINDLAKYVSGEFCLRLEVEEEAKNVSKMTRYISFPEYLSHDSEHFEAINPTIKLRTFLPFSDFGSKGLSLNYGMSSKRIQILLTKFKCLSVLSLCGYQHILELPDSIGNLKHLRYFDLSGSEVAKLPDSICLLYNLQTLKLAYCNSLEELPSHMYKLINLRHLDLLFTRVRQLPNGLEKLKYLEIFDCPFYVGKCGESNLNRLAKLNLRGKLSIAELHNVADPMDALAADLKNKMHLEALRLEWSTNDDGSQNERDVLEKLQPPANLKKLSLENYGGTTFPDWFGDNYLPNLVSLKLSGCKYCFSLPPLGILPSLKKLWIWDLEGIVVIGPEFFGNNSSAAPFGSLQVLVLEKMDGWEEWDCQNASGAFPCLEELRIIDSPQLKNQLPQHLPSLSKLEIINCMQLVASLPCAPAIQELRLRACGTLQWEFVASTLKILKIHGHCMEKSLLEKTIYVNTCLESLKVSDRPNVVDLRLDFLPKLQSLFLHDCSSLERFSMSERLNKGLTSLTKLKMTRCPKFVSFPEGGFFAPTLLECRIGNMESLKSLPEGMHTLFPAIREIYLISCPQLECPEGGFPSSLVKLHIANCPKMVASSMKWGLHSCTSFERLRIGDENVDSFPDQGLLPSTLSELSLSKCSNLKTLDYRGLCHLSSLTCLRIQDCPQLECPEGGFPSSLVGLEITNCPKMVASSVKWGLHSCTSFESLHIEDENVDSFPDQGLLPSTLSHLSLSKCSNLKTLDYRGLCHLSSLERLFIEDCPRLQCLPKEGLPSSLSYLQISGDCPLLQQRCQEQRGEDWSKIAHIRYRWIVSCQLPNRMLNYSLF